MRGSILAATLAVCALVSACKPIDEWIAGQVAEAVAKKSEALAAKIGELEQKQEELARSQSAHKLFNDITRDNYKSEWASLSTDCQTYAVARTDLGPVILTCDTVVPYLDGFKIRLLATVLAPINVVGLKFKVSWSEDDPKFQGTDKKRWREKDIDSLATFAPGRYTAVELPLTPASPAGIKRLSLSVTASQINVPMPASQPR